MTRDLIKELENWENKLYDLYKELHEKDGRDDHITETIHYLMIQIGHRKDSL